MWCYLQAADGVEATVRRPRRVARAIGDGSGSGGGGTMTAEAVHAVWDGDGDAGSGSGGGFGPTVAQIVHALKRRQEHTLNAAKSRPNAPSTRNFADLLLRSDQDEAIMQLHAGRDTRALDERELRKVAEKPA